MAVVWESGISGVQPGLFSCQSHPNLHAVISCNVRTAALQMVCWLHVTMSVMGWSRGRLILGSWILDVFFQSQSQGSTYM